MELSNSSRGYNSPTKKGYFSPLNSVKGHLSFEMEKR
jgi:hypothetical protein